MKLRILVVSAGCLMLPVIAGAQDTTTVKKDTVTVPTTVMTPPTTVDPSGAGHADRHRVPEGLPDLQGRRWLERDPVPRTAAGAERSWLRQRSRDRRTRRSDSFCNSHMRAAAQCREQRTRRADRYEHRLQRDRHTRAIRVVTF